MSAVQAQEGASALDAVLSLITCPVCGEGVDRAPRAVVRCPRGHSFDVARQGYLNLGASQKDARADAPSMVLAREAVQLAGVFSEVARALADAVCEARPDGVGTLLDLAGGTGYYAAEVLRHAATQHPADTCEPEAQAARGLVIDLSAAALKRAARAHPALAAVGVDLTRGIPLSDESVDVIINVFGPRNGEEMRRVLVPGGVCAVVTPRPEHLGELVEHTGMLRVGDNKAQRVERALPGFTRVGTRAVTSVLRLERETLVNLIAMGPSAHHLTPDEIAQRVDELWVRGAQARAAETREVTVSVDVSMFTATSGA